MDRDPDRFVCCQTKPYANAVRDREVVRNAPSVLPLDAQSSELTVHGSVLRAQREAGLAGKVAGSPTCIDLIGRIGDVSVVVL